MKNATLLHDVSSLSSSPYEVRIYNDQLLQLERAFLNPLGQGGDLADMKYAVVMSMMLSFVFFASSSRHVVYAPAKSNKYAASGFPTIGDALTEGSADKVTTQVAIVTYFVRGALSVLKKFDEFIVS